MRLTKLIKTVSLAALYFFPAQFLPAQVLEPTVEKPSLESLPQSSFQSSEPAKSRDLRELDKLAEKIAEHEPPTERPTPASSKRHDATELYELQARLAEHTYEISKSDENRDALLMVYEKLAGLICMPELLKKLSYPGNPKEAGCLELLDKIQALDPQNAPATCIRNGTGSRACQASFSAQEVRELTTGPGSGVPAATEMELKVHLARNQEALRKLDEEFRNHTQAWRAKPSDDNLAAMRKVLAQILAITCKVSFLKLEPFSLTPTPKPAQDELETAIAALQGTSTTGPAKSSGSGGKANPRDFDIFSAKTSAPEKESPAPQSLKRVRLLPPSCLSYIKQALKLTPLLPEPVCYRDSFYAPACLDSLRDARLHFHHREPPASGMRRTGSSKDGLASF